MLLLRGIAPTAKELTYVILWLIECGFRKLDRQNSPRRYFGSPMYSDSNALDIYTFNVTYITLPS